MVAFTSQSYNAGNLSDDTTYDYYYDHENRLTKVLRQGAMPIAEYTYDALGRRIQTIDVAAGTTTRYYYDGWRVLTETNGSDVAQRDYAYGNYLDEALFMVADPTDTATTYYLAHDHLYSPVALLDEDDGTVLERYEYDAYGQRRVYDADFTDERDTSDYSLTVAFTGQRLDLLDSAALPLMNYKNRIYSIPLDRFLQRDPLGVQDGLCLFAFSSAGYPKTHRNFQVLLQYDEGLNIYAYLDCSPLEGIDPFGLKKEKKKRDGEGSMPMDPNEYLELGYTRAVMHERKKCISDFYVYGHGMTSTPGGLRAAKAAEKGDGEMPTDWIQEIGPDTGTGFLYFKAQMPASRFCCVVRIWLCGCYIGHNETYMRNVAKSALRLGTPNVRSVWVYACRGQYKTRWWQHDRHGWCEDDDWKIINEKNF